MAKAGGISGQKMEAKEEKTKDGFVDIGPRPGKQSIADRAA